MNLPGSASPKKKGVQTKKWTFMATMVFEYPEYNVLLYKQSVICKISISQYNLTIHKAWNAWNDFFFNISFMVCNSAPVHCASWIALFLQAFAFTSFTCSDS